MSNKIIIDDGLKTFEIANKEGTVFGSFSFNPSDTNIVHRYKKVIEDLEKLEIDAEKQNSDEENEEAFIENMKQVEEIAYEKINYLLNADVAESFFSIMGPFTPLASGQYFIESVIDAIGQAITMETGERVKRINTKIHKHTGKYHG